MSIAVCATQCSTGWVPEQRLLLLEQGQHLLHVGIAALTRLLEPFVLTIHLTDRELSNPRAPAITAPSIILCERQTGKQPGRQDSQNGRHTHTLTSTHTHTHTHTHKHMPARAAHTDAALCVQLPVNFASSLRSCELRCTYRYTGQNAFMWLARTHAIVHSQAGKQASRRAGTQTRTEDRDK